MTAHLIGKLARAKAKRLTSLEDYKKITSSYGEWLQLENDNALYRRHALLVLPDELAEKVTSMSAQEEEKRNEISLDV